MSWNRRRRYALRWRKYQQRSDFLTFGPDLWFKGKEYDGQWKAHWAVRRHQVINMGVPSSELSTVRKMSTR